MRKLTLPLILGLAHGAADGSAGLLLGGLAAHMPQGQVALLVLAYNALAFGAQPLAGLLVDRVGRPRAAALVGLALLGAALLAFGAQPQLAVALAGLGSAAFHVGAGALAIQATRGRAAGPGLFAAPGVVGLALGGALAAAGVLPIVPALAVLGGLGLAIGRLAMPEPAGVTTSESPNMPATFDGHDLVMLVLLAAIALRSAVWSSLELAFAGRYDLLLALAVSAALGKALGGALADWVGWRRWALGALGLAAPLLALGGRSPIALLAGVALLQSATPVALAATARRLPRYPATAAGLALGLAIAAGGLPPLGGLGPWVIAPPVAASILIAAALALWWALGRDTEPPRRRERQGLEMR